MFASGPDSAIFCTRCMDEKAITAAATAAAAATNAPLCELESILQQLTVCADDRIRDIKKASVLLAALIRVRTSCRNTE